MKLLHVGCGFRPWRRGGLIAYSESLMRAQVVRGHEVTYFLSGRYYPFVSGPRLRRFERAGVRMAEVVNSPLYDHGRQPDAELSEPRVERLFERVLRETRPDVVHVQELAGLPSSVFDIAARHGVPTVFTLQDYFALCPMFKLFDHDGEVCLRHDVGAHCVATTERTPWDPPILVDATVHHDLETTRGTRRLYERLGRARVHRVARALAERSAFDGSHARGPAADRAEAFQRRREVNVERLNRVDRLIAMSHRVAELHGLLGVDAGRMRTMHLTLPHIAELRPRRPTPGAPVTFATLAGLESRAKGARVLLDAAAGLAEAAPAGSYRIVAFGHLQPEFVDEANAIPGVEVRGGYTPAALDSMLDVVDVGLMTSVWEEAYGYAGVEFLAKGIPVIANALGGMVDYTHPGRSGWLNHSRSGSELAEIMLDIVERPEQIAELNTHLIAERDTYVTPFEAHADDIDAAYAEIIAEHYDRAG